MLSLIIKLKWHRLIFFWVVKRTNIHYERKVKAPWACDSGWFHLFLWDVRQKIYMDTYAILYAIHLDCVMSICLCFSCYSLSLSFKRKHSFFCVRYLFTYEWWKEWRRRKDELKNWARVRKNCTWCGGVHLIIIIHDTFSSNCAYWCDISAKTYSPRALSCIPHHHYWFVECQYLMARIFFFFSFSRCDSFVFSRILTLMPSAFESMRINVNLMRNCMHKRNPKWCQCKYTIFLFRSFPIGRKHLMKMFAFLVVTYL